MDAFSTFLFALNPLTTSKCTGQISMAQQGGLQQMVSSASQAPTDDYVEIVDSGPQGPQITQHAISGVGKVGSAMESKNGDSRQTRAWKGKAHGSWRQRNSTESNDVHDMQDGGNNESDSYQNIQIPMERQQVQKMSETSLLRGHSKHANDNHDSAVPVSSPITKDHKAVVRERHLPFRRQKGTGVNHDTDQKKNAGDTRKESLLSSSDHNQQDLNAVSTESQSTEERMSSHWQPKFQASNNQRGNRHKKKESTHTGISFRDGQDTEYSAIVPPPSQSVSEKGWGDDDWNLETVRESRNAPPKGHLHSNQVAVSSSELAPTVHQLDLQLSFIDFLGGKKVQVILDMACLKCGAYPAEVLPSQIYDSAASREQNLPSLLVNKIRTAAKLRLLNCSEFTEEDMQWFTSNEHESNIHVAPMWTLASFKRLKHISSQYASLFSLIVAFSPTGWTFGKGRKKSPGRRWQQGTVIRYEVPYSEHSSFTELKEFVNFVSPNNIIPSVNNDGPESAEAMVSLLST
ncbi:hypothetical protein RYX36_004117 [Vicia faba]